MLHEIAELMLQSHNRIDTDKLFISYPSEPFQQAVIWPTYSQPQTTLQAQHMLMPSLTASQLPPPPPLAPFVLGADYLAASTTLHQVRQSDWPVCRLAAWPWIRHFHSFFFFFFSRSTHKRTVHVWWHLQPTTITNESPVVIQMCPLHRLQRSSKSKIVIIP